MKRILLLSVIMFSFAISTIAQSGPSTKHYSKAQLDSAIATKSGYVYTANGEDFKNFLYVINGSKRDIAYKGVPANGYFTYQTSTEFDSTGTITAAKLVTGYITSTSAAATTITTPTATQIATQLGSGQGTVLTFIIDNTGGANTVTITPGSGVTTGSVITGGTTMTVASGTLGTFQIILYSSSAAKIARLQ